MLKPDMYKKDITKINYDKLKKLGIKTIAFDFDNTIIEPGSKVLEKKIKNCLINIKKDFHVIVVSNTVKGKRIKKYCNEIGLEYILFACKPLNFGFKRARKLHNSKPNELCMVGDQYFTDILGAKKKGYYTVLIDQIGPRENIFTKTNRLKEKKLYQKNNFIKGNYYD